MAYIVMVYTVMAHIVMVYIVMTYVVMAYRVMVYIVMADLCFRRATPQKRRSRKQPAAAATGRGATHLQLQSLTPKTKMFACRVQRRLEDLWFGACTAWCFDFACRHMQQSVPVPGALLDLERVHVVIAELGLDDAQHVPVELLGEKDEHLAASVLSLGLPQSQDVA